MTGETDNKLEVLNKILPELDGCIQNVGKREKAVPVDATVRTQNTPATPDSTHRISMTTQLDKSKGKGKGKGKEKEERRGTVRNYVARMEEQIAKQKEVKTPQRPIRKH